MGVTVSKFQPNRWKKKLTWKIMKNINTSSHLYCPASAAVGAPATGPAGKPGSGAGFCYLGGFGFQKFWNLGGSGSQRFGTRVGPGFKVLVPRWVQFTKKWRRKLPVTWVPGLPWNPDLGLVSMDMVLQT